MSLPRGVIQKLVFEPVLHTVYLRRNEELMAEFEWEWSEKADEGFIFPTFDAAEKRVAELKAEGEEHIHAVVVSELQERLRKERELRHELAAQETEASAAELDRLEACLPSQAGSLTSGRRQKPLNERVAIARRGVRTRQARQHISQEEYTEKLEREKLF